MKAIGLLIAIFALAAAALAADITGTYTGDVKIPSGQALPFVAHLKQDGDKVTGKLDGIGGAPDVVILNGMVDGDTVTFSGVRQIQGAAVKFNYIGKIMGDSIDFKIVRDDGQGMPLESMTKRTSATP